MPGRSQMGEVAVTSSFLKTCWELLSGNPGLYPAGISVCWKKLDMKYKALKHLPCEPRALLWKLSGMWGTPFFLGILTELHGRNSNVKRLLTCMILHSSPRGSVPVLNPAAELVWIESWFVYCVHFLSFCIHQEILWYVAVYAVGTVLL